MPPGPSRPSGRLGPSASEEGGVQVFRLHSVTIKQHHSGPLVHVRKVMTKYLTVSTPHLLLSFFSFFPQEVVPSSKSIRKKIEDWLSSDKEVIVTPQSVHGQGRRHPKAVQNSIRHRRGRKTHDECAFLPLEPHNGRRVTHHPADGAPPVSPVKLNGENAVMVSEFMPEVDGPIKEVRRDIDLCKGPDGHVRHLNGEDFARQLADLIQNVMPWSRLTTHPFIRPPLTMPDV